MCNYKKEVKPNPKQPSCKTGKRCEIHVGGQGSMKWETRNLLGSGLISLPSQWTMHDGRLMAKF